MTDKIFFPFQDGQDIFFIDSYLYLFLNRLIHSPENTWNIVALHLNKYHITTFYINSFICPPNHLLALSSEEVGKKI